MSQQSPAQARVVDPILSTQARGYRRPGNIGAFLFPRVYVNQRGGKVIEFGKEAFKLYATGRAPGGTIKRVQFGYEGKPYGIGINTIEVPIPLELQQEAAAVPGIDLGRRAVNLGMGIHSLNHEVACATLAQNAALYDANHKVALAGVARWDDPASNPIKNVLDWRESIRATTGATPNVLCMGPKVFTAACDNPAIKDRVKYTSADSITAQLLARLFQVDAVYVGEAVTADDAGAFTDVWGKNVVLAYVPKSQGDVNAQEEPSYGYTYTMQGHPAVWQPYFENQSRSWIYPAADDNTPALTGITAGFLATTVVN